MTQAPFSARVQCLNAADIFCDLSPAELGELARRAPVRQVEEKALIYTPDEPTEVMFFLNEGRVQLYQLGANGKTVTNAVLEAGMLFGEMALLGQTMNQHYAQAVSACVLCVMTTADVHRLLLSDVRISNRLVYSLGKRLLDTQRQLSMVTLKPVLNRVAWALLHLAEQAGGQEAGQKARAVGAPTLRTTHEVVASLVGATRETVTKILNEFEAQEWIRLGRGQIALVNAAALAALAEL